MSCTPSSCCTEVKSCILRVLRPRVFWTPHQPSNSLSSFSPQPAYRLLCEVEDKCTHPQICLGSFHNRFSKFISTLFLPHTAAIGTTLSIPVIEISMSTLCSEQGTQRDHPLLYPVLHVDAYSATNQTCFQQQLTQRSVHIIKWGGGKKYQPCLLAAGARPGLSATSF